MKKKLTALVLATMLALTTSVPALACTPKLHVDMPQISNIKYEPSDQMKAACDNAAKKYLEEHPVDLKTDDKESETEEVIEATKPEVKNTFNWRDYNFRNWRTSWFAAY